MSQSFPELCWGKVGLGVQIPASTSQLGMAVPTPHLTPFHLGRTMPPHCLKGPVFPPNLWGLCSHLTYGMGVAPVLLISIRAAGVRAVAARQLGVRPGAAVPSH